MLLIPQVAWRTHLSPLPPEPGADPSIHPSTKSNGTLCACIRSRGQSEREIYKVRLGRNVGTCGMTQRLEEKMKNKQSTAEKAD